MTISLEITLPGTIPSGTTVKAYPMSAVPDVLRAPVGASVAEGETAGQKVTLAGLEENVQYLIGAEVNGRWRYVHVTAGNPIAASILRSDQNAAISGDWGFRGKIGFFGTAPVAKPAALSAVSAEAIDAVYGEQEKKVLESLKKRSEELETKLKALGLLS